MSSIKTSTLILASFLIGIPLVSAQADNVCAKYGPYYSEVGNSSTNSQQCFTSLHGVWVQDGNRSVCCAKSDDGILRSEDKK